jgi:hypothetical protein
MKVEMNIRSAMLKGGELTLPISTLKNIFSPYFASEQFSAPVGSAYSVILPEVEGKSLTPPVSPYYEAIPPAPPGWWDPNWTKRRAITISGYHPTDYQLKIVLPFYDPSIRFLENAGSGLLPYWVESYTANSMTVWVKRSIANDGDDHTIYVYYNNPNAGSASDGNATFMFFDDFSGDLSKWSTPPSGVVIENGALKIPAGADSAYYLNTLYSLTSFNPQGTAIEMRTKISGATVDDEWYVGYRGDSSNCYKSVHAYSTTRTFDIGIEAHLSGIEYREVYGYNDVYAQNAWWRFSFRKDTGTTLTLVDVDTPSRYLTWTKDVLDDLTNTRVGLSRWGNYGNFYIDFVFVRKYTVPEPTVSVGNEEQYGG